MKKSIRGNGIINGDTGRVYGYWDGEDVSVLMDKIDRGLAKQGGCICWESGIPHLDQIPRDLQEITDFYDCDVAVLAADKNGNCVVWSEEASSEFTVMSFASIRSYLMSVFDFVMSNDGYLITESYREAA